MLTGGDSLLWWVETQLNWSKDRSIQSYLKKILMTNIPTIEHDDLCSKPHMNLNITLKLINLWCDLDVYSRRVIFWTTPAWTKNNLSNVLNKTSSEKTNQSWNQLKLLKWINTRKMCLLFSQNHVHKSLEYPEFSWVKIKMNKMRAIPLWKESIYGFQNIQSQYLTRNLS